MFNPIVWGVTIMFWGLIYLASGWPGVFTVLGVCVFGLFIMGLGARG